MSNGCNCTLLVFSSADFLSTFQKIAQEMLKLIKHSPTRENFLEQTKKEAPSDLMWDNPEDAGKVMHWNPTRWTENKRSFLGITNNYGHLHKTFERQNSSVETSDGVMRSRCASASKHLSALKYYFESSLCMCFLGPLDFLNASMKNPKKISANAS